MMTQLLPVKICEKGIQKETCYKRKKMKHKGDRKEEEEWLGREGTYQENADVSMGLSTINMVILLGNGDSFHDCGLQVDEWVNLFESLAEM
jgi:hypothetical protein